MIDADQETWGKGIFQDCVHADSIDYGYEHTHPSDLMPPPGEHASRQPFNKCT